MKKRLLFLPLTALVVGVAVLFAAPFVAAQTTVTIGSSTYDYYGDYFNGGGPYNQSSPVDIGSISSANMVAGIITDDATGDFTLSGIKLVGTATTSLYTELTGFVFRNAGSFSGTINHSGIIDITNTGDTSAIGAYFRDTNRNGTSASNGTYWADITGNISFDTIKATNTATGEAYGFVSGAVMGGGSVVIDDVQVTSKGAASGVQIFGKGASTGSITVNSINVQGIDGATGLLVGGANHDAGSFVYHDIANVTVGSINVGASGGDAYGIDLRNVDNLVLKGNITATGGDAVGIKVRDAVVSLDNHVNISATGNTGTGILANDMKINLLGHHLTSTSTTVANNLSIESFDSVLGEIFDVDDPSNPTTADLGIVNIGGKLTTEEPIVTIKGGTINSVDAFYLNIVGGTTTITGSGGDNITILGGNGDLIVNNGNLNIGVGQFDGTVTTLAGNITVEHGGKLKEINASANFSASLTIGDLIAESVTIGGNLDVKGGFIAHLGDLKMTNTSGATITIDNPGTWAQGMGLSAGLMADSTTAAGNLTVVGQGQADLGIVTMQNGGDFTIGDTTGSPASTVVALNIAASTLGSNNILNSDGKLAVYDDGSVPAGFAVSFTGDGVAAGNFEDRSQFNIWEMDAGGNIVLTGARASARFNDNYLAASRMHHKYTAWNAVRDHLISGAGVSQRYGYYGQSYCEQAACFSGCCCKMRNTWINYVGRSSRYQSSYNGDEWKLTSNGMQVGTDFFRTPRAQLGGFFGYEGGTGTNASDRIQGKDYYLGLYAVNVFRNGSDLRTVFSYGWQDFDSKRFAVADSSVYNASFKGNTAELNIEFGQRHYAGNWSARPSIALDWHLSYLNGGRETSAGSNAVRYDSTDLSQLFFRFGSDLRYSCGRLTLDSGLYYSYDMLGRDLKSGVSSIAGQQSTLLGSTLGRSVISYNFGASWIVNSKLSVFGGYRGEYAPESAGKGYANVGYVGAALRW